MKTYSENGEDKVIEEYFHHYNGGNQCRFLDIGAYSPTKLCNTRAVVERGWHGTYVVPSPASMIKFKQLYFNQFNLSLIGSMVAEKEGYAIVPEYTIEFDSRPPFGIISKTEKLIEVKSQNINKLFSEQGIDIDLICIDVAGHNYKLLQLLSQDLLHRLRMICIAHENLSMLIENKLKGFGFNTKLMNSKYCIMAKN